MNTTLDRRVICLFLLFISIVYSSLEEYEPFTAIQRDKLIAFFPLDFDISNVAHYFDQHVPGENRLGAIRLLSSYELQFAENNLDLPLF
jgi:hypothetical protein